MTRAAGSGAAITFARMTGSSDQKLSLRALVALVVGSMIGSGIFALPSAFGRATGGLGALIAWCIAGGGMLMLAFVFQTLSRRRPDLDAGIYAYARAGFGEYLGFASAAGYWIGCCLADVACLVLIKATLGLFFPVFGDGTTPVAILSASMLLWAVHVLILRGIKEAAALNTVATVAKIVPIGLFIVVAIVAFRTDTFALNFWGGEEPGLANVARPGPRHHACHCLCVRRHRGRKRLLALRQKPQRRGTCDGARVPRRSLPAGSGDDALLRHPRSPGACGLEHSVHGGGHGSHRRAVGRGLHQHRPADLDPRQLSVMVAACGGGSALGRENRGDAVLPRPRKRQQGAACRIVADEHRHPAFSARDLVCRIRVHRSRSR